MRYGRYNHQGYFGESFVRVLASAAGLVAGKQDIDVTGVDFSIGGSITLASTTPDGTYSGTFAVTADYQ